MQKKLPISIAVLAVVLLGVLIAQGAMGTPQASTVERASINDVTLQLEMPEDFDKLKENIPPTVKEAEAAIVNSAHKFLLWTHDGVHVMWGYYGNGFFTGMDNLGKRVWGIYGKDVFAGLYDGEFFWGRYRNGYWRAIDLFGESSCHGRYELFPGVTLVPLQLTNTVP